MRAFNYHQSSQIVFGKGKLNEIGDIAKKYGKRALLVTSKGKIPEFRKQYERVKSLLSDKDIEVIHFDEVIPNPTKETITAGANMAKESAVDMIIGMGGGSSMDAAKAISVEATHEGTSWDYLFYKSPQPKKEKLLPVIAVSTSSGTGSQVTQVAVITNEQERDKSALYNNVLFPEVCIIDPELMLTAPEWVTATTGFDVFCHAFESIIHPAANPYIDLMAWEALGIVVEYLPLVLSDLKNIMYREKMAYADTLAGLCIANAGVTLPHGMGMAIGGMYPQVAHAEALAMVYPAFAEFTWENAVPKFSKLYRILNPELMDADDKLAASKSKEELSKFIRRINLNKKLSDVGVPENELIKLADQCMVLPDYKGNPRVATRDEMIELVKACY